jgi:hypothetical protein
VPSGPLSLATTTICRSKPWSFNWEIWQKREQITSLHQTKGSL